MPWFWSKWLISRHEPIDSQILLACLDFGMAKIGSKPNRLSNNKYGECMCFPYINYIWSLWWTFKESIMPCSTQHNTTLVAIKQSSKRRTDGRGCDLLSLSSCQSMTQTRIRGTPFVSNYRLSDFFDNKFDHLFYLKKLYKISLFLLWHILSIQVHQEWLKLQVRKVQWSIIWSGESR